MRVAAWVFVVCTVLAAIGVFLPNIEVRIAGVAFSHRTSMSLYQINTSRDFVRKMIAQYHRSPGKRVGAVVTGTLMPHLGGHVHEALDDATSAMELLDDVTDDQARTGGEVFRIVIIAFLAISGLMAAVIFSELMRGVFRKSRVIAALVMSVLTTPVAIGTLIMTRALVWEVNDEVGGEIVAATVGAYVIAISACVAFVAMIALVVKRPRLQATTAAVARS